MSKPQMFKKLKQLNKKMILNNKMRVVLMPKILK